MAGDGGRRLEIAETAETVEMVEMAGDRVGVTDVTVLSYLLKREIPSHSRRRNRLDTKHRQVQYVQLEPDRCGCDRLRLEGSLRGVGARIASRFLVIFSSFCRDHNGGRPAGSETAGDGWRWWRRVEMVETAETAGDGRRSDVTDVTVGCLVAGA